MTSPLFSPPVWGLIFAVSAATLLWLVSLRLKDVSIVDMFWGPGIAAVVDVVALLGPASGPRTSTWLFLGNLWGVALGAHIWARHKGEDQRYAAMRARVGASWWWVSLVQV